MQDYEEPHPKVDLFGKMKNVLLAPKPVEEDKQDGPSVANTIKALQMKTMLDKLVQ